MPTSMTGSVRARREQFLAYNDERGFRLSQGFVLGKLLNQSNLLKLMAKNRKQASPLLAEKLYSGGREIDAIAEKVRLLEAGPIDGSRQSIMNLEAGAARTYWERVALTIPEGFSFPGRKTVEPQTLSTPCSTSAIRWFYLQKFGKQSLTRGLTLTLAISTPTGPGNPPLFLI